MKMNILKFLNRLISAYMYAVFKALREKTAGVKPTPYV